MKMIETIYTLGICLLPASVCVFLIWAGFHLLWKEKTYRSPAQGWLDIRVYKIPDDIKEYIATDGKEVSTKYGITWGPHGEIIFSSYDKTYIKFWQPLPEAPKN